MVKLIKQPFLKHAQANFFLPENLLKDLKNLVPRGGLSKLVADAIEKELRHLKFEKAMEESFGAWKNRKDIKNT